MCLFLVEPGEKLGMLEIGEVDMAEFEESDREEELELTGVAE